MQIRGFHWQDGNVCLIEEPSYLADVWKNFKYWLNLSNPSLNYWTYFPNDCWVILKQVKMLNFLLRFEFQIFDKFHWMLRYLFLKIILFTLIFIFIFFDLSSCLSFFSILLELRHLIYVLIYLKKKLLCSNSILSSCCATQRTQIAKGLENFNSCFAYN